MAKDFVDYVYDLISKRQIVDIDIVLPCERLDNMRECLLLEDGHLGIPANILQCVYTELYHSTVAACAANSSHPEASKLTNALVLCNANCSLFWNKRKRLCLICAVSLKDEDYLSSLVLKLYPKCAAIYEHRRWLLTQRGFAEVELLRAELQLSLHTADRYANNYYSWSHRQWCLTQFNRIQVFRDDLASVRKWRETHVSQYCAFSHCQFLLACLKLSLEELLYEYKDICDLIELYPTHESLSYHRKWVVYQLSKFDTESCREIVRREVTPSVNSKRLSTRYVKGLSLLLDNSTLADSQ